MYDDLSMNIQGFQPFGLSDYPGHPSAVVFTQGCNFNCPFCHNRSLIPQNTSSPGMPEQELFDFLHKRQGALEGVVITGGEPLLQKDIVPFLQKLRTLPYKIKLDTNGSLPDILDKIIRLRLADYLAMDIKAPWPQYQKLCGVPVNIQAVKKSIQLITDSYIPHEFRTTFVPSLLTEQDLICLQRQLPENAAFKKQRYVQNQRLFHRQDTKNAKIF